MRLSMRLSAEERALAESFTRSHSLTLAEAFKPALFERIEDEFDIAVADEAFKETARIP